MQYPIKSLLVGSLLLLGAGACSDLEVVNQNDADAERALASAGDVESLIAGSFNTWWNGVYSSNGPGLFLSNQAFQHSPPWANQGMEYYGRLPRLGISNDVADNFYDNFARVWYRSYRAIAAVSDGLRSLEKAEVADELGPEGVARAKAYGYFVLGTAHATVAVLYDRGFAVDGTTDPSQAQELKPYPGLMDAALGYLDEAISLCTTSFTLPFGWMQAEVTNEDLARIASSYKARFYASAARTPAEREALNWNNIISWIDQGVQGDFLMYWDWDNGWYNSYLDYAVWPGWTQMPYFIYGMADPRDDRVFNDWLDLGLKSKGHNLPDGTPFLIVTPDTRFPQGATVEEQRANQGEYFHIATAGQAGDTWQNPNRGYWRWSWYKHYRMLEYGWSGVFEQPEIRASEMDLLKAEALFRTGDAPGAAAIVNEYRTAHGLSSTDGNGANASCLPRFPDGSCGGLWEMLKWEKRMETAHTGIAGAGWFFDSRGWGDLWKDTPLQLPIPCRELQVLQLLPCNTYGGPGGEMGSSGSTYAWPNEG